MILAMVFDEQGFAKYSRLYPGNQAEGKTLVDMVKSMGCRFNDCEKDRSVVMDAGIANAENIEYLKENDLRYIVVNRGKTGFKVDDTCDMISTRKNGNCAMEGKNGPERRRIRLCTSHEPAHIKNYRASNFSRFRCPD